MAFFLKLKLNYLSKMHGYPQFSFWIPRILTKIYFLQIVLRGVALNHRKTMAAKEAFSQRTLQIGCMDDSMK